MKIVHFIYDSPANPWLNGGGAERLRKLYENSPHDVTIYSGNYHSASSTLGNANVQRLGVSWNYAASRLTYFLLAMAYACFVKSDIIVEDVGFPGPLITLSFRKHSVASVQFIPNASYTEKRGPMGKMVHVYYRLFLGRYRNIMTVSKYAATELKRLAPSAEIVVIPNGVDEIEPPKKTGVGNYFLYLGRIDIVAKGIDTLIESYGRYLQNGGKQKLMIAGSGEQEEISKLRHLMRSSGAKSIQYLGYITGPKKQELISKATAIVLPSKNETSSLSALEAFANATPVVANSVGGLGEIVRDSKGGIAVKLSDIDGFSQALDDITDPAIHASYANSAKRYSRKLQWPNIARDYFTYLESQK